MFYVGQEVVCVNTEDHPKLHEIGERHNILWVGGLDGLKKGNHYHVAAIGWDSWFNEETITVVEIKRRRNVGRAGRVDPDSYAAWRFRPVQKKSTDISSLIALLNPANHKKLEDA